MRRKDRRHNVDNRPIARRMQPLQFVLVGDNNETLEGTLVLDTFPMSGKDGGVNSTGKFYDEAGASAYAIAVIAVYGFSIVLLIASHIFLKKKEDKKDGDEQQIDKYLQQVPMLKEKSQKDSFRKLKKSIIPLVSVGLPQDITAIARAPLGVLPEVHRSITHKIPPAPMGMGGRRLSQVGNRQDLRRMAHMHQDSIHSTESECQSAGIPESEEEDLVFDLEPPDTPVEEIPDSAPLLEARRMSVIMEESLAEARSRRSSVSSNRSRSSFRSKGKAVVDTSGNTLAPPTIVPPTVGPATESEDSDTRINMDADTTTLQHYDLDTGQCTDVIVHPLEGHNKDASFIDKVDQPDHNSSGTNSTKGQIGPTEIIVTDAEAESQGRNVHAAHKSSNIPQCEDQVSNSSSSGRSHSGDSTNSMTPILEAAYDSNSIGSCSDVVSLQEHKPGVSSNLPVLKKDDTQLKSGSKHQPRPMFLYDKESILSLWGLPTKQKQSKSHSNKDPPPQPRRSSKPESLSPGSSLDRSPSPKEAKSPPQRRTGVFLSVPPEMFQPVSLGRLAPPSPSRGLPRSRSPVRNNAKPPCAQASQTFLSPAGEAPTLLSPTKNIRQSRSPIREFPAGRSEGHRGHESGPERRHHIQDGSSHAPNRHSLPLVTSIARRAGTLRRSPTPPRRQGPPSERHGSPPERRIPPPPPPPLSFATAWSGRDTRWQQRQRPTSLPTPVSPQETHFLSPTSPSSHVPFDRSHPHRSSPTSHTPSPHPSPQDTPSPRQTPSPSGNSRPGTPGSQHSNLGPDEELQSQITVV